MQSHNQRFDMIVRGIVMTRGENGATIEEMREDYFKMFSEFWPLQSVETAQIVTYLIEIHGLMMEKQDSGLCIWYIDDIGSNISERHFDSNNNVNVAGPSDVSCEVLNNSHGLVAPRLRRQIVTSSFVSGNTVPSLSSSATSSSANTVSSASTEALNFFEPIENKRESAAAKRKFSQDSCPCAEKRMKLTETDRVPLIEKNLDIHNWNSGTNGVVKQVTTSTEKENSILALNGVANGGNDAIECIEEIEVASDSDYHASIERTEMKKLEKEFPERCQIGTKSKNVQTDSVTSTDSIDDELIRSQYALLGDDFMRSFISFELYGGDFTDENDNKRYSFCFSGQTVRQAYHMVLDKQNEFRANYPNIVVNVGAIDILLQRNLIDIQTEYARLVKAICTIGCVPILTTIPELLTSPNNPNKKIIRQMVLLFNRFLTDLYSDGYSLIDLYPCLSTKSSPQFDNSDYYQQPKRIRVENQELELRVWALNGRKKILRALNECDF